LIDNLNQSAGILGKELTKNKLQRNLYDILESSTSTTIIFADKNLLDGFECSITLSVQNSIEVCEDFSCWCCVKYYIYIYWCYWTRRCQ
jgi:hypothetical protein